ncbi:MAG TPA: flavodoxin [Methanolinea sp.]|nr:flavodoxin [Methanolinea sp.]
MSGGGVAAAEGLKGKKKSVLVCYASRYGSTKDIAEWIEEELIRLGMAVDCRPAGRDVDPAAYDAPVLGSPLYMGKWLPEAREQVSRERGAFGRIPVAVFSVGYSLKEPNEKALKGGEAALSDVRLFITPRDAAFFPGMVDPGRLTPADKAILTLAGISGGDFRDKERVCSWARTLPAVLGLL